MLKLDERLEFVYSKIPQCNVLCDIGCDHGKLSCKIAKDGRAKKVIAVDISQKSLDKTVKLAKEENVDNIVECRRGDGFSAICEDESDVCVIAGMGGVEIIKILSTSPLKFNKYVIVPHQNAPQLRVFLQDNGFSIESDNIKSCKGKFYSVILASQGNCNLSQREILFGKDEDGSDFLNYLKMRKAKIDDINKGFVNTEKNLFGQELKIIEEILNGN